MLFNPTFKATKYKVYEDMPGSVLLDELVFPVEAKELLSDCGDEGYQYCGNYGIFTRGKFTADTIVSGEYNLIPNKDIIERLEVFFNKGYGVERTTNYDDKEFSIHMIKDELISIGNFTEAKPQIKIVNSYDGTSSLRLEFGVYILVCGNGAYRGVKASISKKHIGNWSFSEWLESAEFEAKYMANLEKFGYKTWENTGEAIMDMFKDLTKGIPATSKGGATVLQLINDKYEKELLRFGNEEFALFMAVTDIATHGQDYGVAPSYQLALEDKIPATFNLG